MSEETRVISPKHYPPEFKSAAVKLVLQQGYTCEQAGQQLGVPKKPWPTGCGRIASSSSPPRSPRGLRSMTRRR